MNVVTPLENLLPKDFASDQEVRWCPGCGDYAILKSMLKALAQIGTARENVVFVSGIGCAARFPYYISTYGFHTIHGRAPAIATGIKLTNPALDVWVVTGDGDGLSIGANHLYHALRRNVNLQILLFNNETYGLTKGQYSPTSRVGTRSPSTPLGSLDNPVSPLTFALGAGARFVARGIDTHQKSLPDLFNRAHSHQGASFVEIFQNCIVYNDGVFDDFTDRKNAEDTQIHLEHGKPMIFGSDRNRGIMFKSETFELKEVILGEDGINVNNLLIHDETNLTLAGMLATMEPPYLPMALGVIYCDPGTAYDLAVAEQIEQAQREEAGDLSKILHSGTTWTVGP